MTTIVAGLVCVLAITGMVASAVWYRRARFRTISGRLDGVRFNTIR